MSKFLPLLMLIACGDKETSDSNDDQNNEFQTGNFQFTNTKVNDQCLDGAFTVLFLPAGDGTTHDWQYPIELPAEEDLPANYSIRLEDPFSEMEVTVTAGTTSGTLVIEDATQTDVLFDATNSPDCVVDLSIAATITITDSDNITGQGALSVVEYRGSDCPNFEQSPCDILLDFTGKRL